MEGSKQSERNSSLFQLIVLLMIVLMALKPEAFSGFDIGGEIVDVEGVLGNELIALDGALVKSIVRFHAANFIRHHRSMKMCEHGEGFVNPGMVDRIDVGKKDESMPLARPALDELPGFDNGSEDRTPRGDEFFTRRIRAECRQCPGDEFFGSDASAFQIITLEIEPSQSFAGVAQLGGN